MVSKRQERQAFRRAKPQEDVIDTTVTDEDDNRKNTEAEEIQVVEAVRQGEKRSTVNILGHKVSFHILNVKQELQADWCASDLQGSYGFDLAMQAAFFGMAVDSIDDEPFHISIKDTEDVALARYNKAIEYYPKFILEFSKEYAALRKKSSEEIEAIKKS
jgi:hypothetical protein